MMIFLNEIMSCVRCSWDKRKRRRDIPEVRVFPLCEKKWAEKPVLERSGTRRKNEELPVVIRVHYGRPIRMKALDSQESPCKFYQSLSCAPHWDTVVPHSLAQLHVKSHALLDSSIVSTQYTGWLVALFLSLFDWCFHLFHISTQ